VTPILASTRQLAITVAIGKLLIQLTVPVWWSTKRITESWMAKRGVTECAFICLAPEFVISPAASAAYTIFETLTIAARHSVGTFED
jgi:hypothetical protein